MLKLFKLAKKKEALKKGYSQYRKNVQSPFLRKLGAESLRENVRKVNNQFKQITNQN